jgi:aminopeptidase N
MSSSNASLLVNHRLPSWVKPNKYTITLEPNLVEFTFDGEVAVEFIVNEPTDKLLLNAKELTIHSANVEGTLNATSITLDEETETVLFQFDQQIKKGGVLNVKFSGILNDKMAGFYRYCIRD